MLDSFPNHKVEMPSILPYLDPTRAKLHLDLSSVSHDISMERTKFPFLVMSEADPFSRVIEARFVTDAGTEIKRVFVLLQRDEYLITRDELRPVNNRDIDQWWQRAFSSYGDESRSGSVIVLGDQISEEGGLIPLQPLLFCTKKQVYFHSLCPKCGFPLEQCYDDEVLTGLGLQPHSSSLRRYLFCQFCFSSSSESDFYAYSAKGSDPPILKDRWDMIRGFGPLERGENHVDEFPCTECPGHGECYGAEGLALSRIIPFSFYPFHMLIFGAMSVNAVDFLSLISGASFEDMEGRLREKGECGRIGCVRALKERGQARESFFFHTDERYFLEVLYLKLSFLGEITQTVFSRTSAHKRPDLGFSLDRIWVKLSDQVGLLPFFWNFDLKLIGIGGSAVSTDFLPEMPPAYGLDFLGLLWFYTLLVNKRQDVSDVYKAIGQAMEKMTSDASLPPGGFLDDEFNLTFLPENIFWNPEETAVSESWGQLWNTALGMGWSLLRLSVSQNSGWSKEAFRQELETLREEINERMFRQGFSPTETIPAAEDKAIHAILMKIREQWREDMTTAKPEIEKAAVVTDGEDGEGKDLDETVVMSAADAGALKETVVRSEPDVEALDETVVISRPDSEAMDKTIVPSTQDRSTVVPQEEEEIGETVILSSGDVGKDASVPHGMKEDDLSETVIISSSEKSSPLTGSPQLSPRKGSDFHRKGAASEKEPGESEGWEKSKDTPDTDNFLEATVIISPDKGGKNG